MLRTGKAGRDPLRGLQERTPPVWCHGVHMHAAIAGVSARHRPEWRGPSRGRWGRHARGRFVGRGGSGFHPTIARTQSRAFSLSFRAGKSRRSSTTADNSPLSSNTWRMAAAVASSTLNIGVAPRSSRAGQVSPGVISVRAILSREPYMEAQWRTTHMTAAIRRPA